MLHILRQLLNRSLPLLFLCLLGGVVTASLAAETPASKPGTDHSKPRQIEETLDLQTILRESGYGAPGDYRMVRQFVEYGSQERYQRFRKADQFDRGDIQKEIDAHQRKIAKQAFVLRGLPVVIPDRGNFDEAKGLAVITTLGLRLFRNTPADGGVRSKSLASVRPCRANAGEYWFLTKDHKMARCRSAAQVREVEKNDGFLYHPDVPATSVALVLAVEREAAKQIGRNPRDYTIDIVLDGLRFEKPLEWGYYLRKALLEADGDCATLVGWNSSGLFNDAPDPHYFRVDATKQEPCVSSVLVTVSLRDKEGKAIASYVADEQYKHLLLNPTDRLPRLLKTLRNGPERDKASRSLVQLGAAALPYLQQALKDDNADFRVRVLGILGLMGPRAKAAVPTLNKLRSDSREAKEVRAAADAALAKVADEKTLVRLKENEALITTLTPSLKDKRAAVRLAAVNSLAKLGSDVTPAIPALVELLGDRSPQVRLGAAVALASAGPDVVSALLDCLKSKNASVRQAATQALALLGVKGKAAVPALIEALQDTNALVRRGAASVLGYMGAEAKDAIPALVKMGKDRAPGARAIAAAALQAIQNPRPAVGPHLPGR